MDLPSSRLIPTASASASTSATSQHQPRKRPSEQISSTTSTFNNSKNATNTTINHSANTNTNLTVPSRSTSASTSRSVAGQEQQPRSLRSSRKLRKTSSSSANASEDMYSSDPPYRPRTRVQPAASPVSDEAEAVRLTKTGRISRALKGQPVHKCDVCEKFYTRAEHLRRHQSSHKNQPTWLCNVAGCEKSNPGKGFATEDLLQRHKEDAHLLGGFQVTNSRPSPGLPAYAVAHHPESSGVYSDVTSRGFGSQYDSSYGISPAPYSDLRHSVSSMTGTIQPDAFAAHSAAMATSMPVTSFSYASPGGFADDQWQQSTTLNPSRSLTPASCLSPFSVPTWSSALDAQPSLQRDSPTASDYTIPTSVSSPSLLGMPFDAPCPEIMSLIDLDEQDMALIEGDVNHLAGMTTDCIGHATFWLLEDRYMPFFWQCFYPSFPIIHRSTYFSATDIPASLKALMIAIGASFVQGSDAKLVTQTLCSSVSDILKRHENPSSRSRTWDLQIAFLAEILSIYCSRRTVQGLSPRFESLSTMLQLDPSIRPVRISESLAACNSTDRLVKAHPVWMEQEARRRLLLACYILETQQGTLFERHKDLAYADMTLACSSEAWEAQDLIEWRSYMQRQGDNTISLYDVLDRPESIRYDAFNSSLMVSFITGNKFTVAPPPLLLQSIAAQPQSEFYYHAMQLASNTPIRDIIAIAGESFMFGGKVGSSLEFEQAKQDLQLWTRTESVSKAMYHAVHLLRTAFEKGNVSLMLEDWSLYLSALVCWVVGVWTQRHASQPPSPINDQWLAVDINDQMREFLSRFEAGFDSSKTRCSDTESTRSCLKWTKERLSHTVGGSVNDAVHVLGRLATV